MAALSPENALFGKKTVRAVFLRRHSLAETPPAKTRLFVSGYFSMAFCSFSKRMSQAVSSNEAAKSATCCFVRSLASS